MKLYIKTAKMLKSGNQFPENYILECVQEHLFGKEHEKLGPWEEIEIENFEQKMQENADLMTAFQVEQQRLERERLDAEAAKQAVEPAPMEGTV